jgi:uncharacterized peroxidase-related enzyme
MTWIKTVDPKKASGRTKEVYDSIRERRGHIANVFLAEGMEPEALAHQVDLYLELMLGEGPLSREEREMIAVMVSAANKSPYGTIHHSEALEKVEGDPEALAKVLAEFMSRNEAPRTKALLAYAAKVTLAPREVTEEDIKDLREAGLTDQEVLRANLIASYFNFLNRVTLGLGVQVENVSARKYKY